MRLIIIGLILSFLICYLEWGMDQSSFVFQAEYDILIRKPQLQTFLHPVVLAGLIGQFLLVFSVLRIIPNKKMALTGLIPLLLFVVFLFLIGLFSLNMKILTSTLPFLFLSILFFTRYRKEAK